MRVCAAGFRGLHWRGLLTVILLFACLGTSDISLARTNQRTPPESGKVFDVREFGAMGDGRALDTLAIAKAIQAAGAAGAAAWCFHRESTCPARSSYSAM